MSANQQRKGFTFIELLFVIVILGIVGGMTLEAVRQYYNGIYRTQEIMKRTETADHVLDQLKGYFEYAVENSGVNLDRQGAADGCYRIWKGKDLFDYTVAFIAADQDSLRTTGNFPGWNNGITPTGNTIVGIDVNYTAAGNIIQGLGSTLADSALYNDNGDPLGCEPFNWNGDNNLTAYYTIAGVSGNTLTVTNNNAHTSASETPSGKYLFRTGYAFRVDQDDEGKFYMYTNFRPWKGENYETNGTKNLLAEKVNHFYLTSPPGSSSKGGGTIVTLKVCMQGLDENLSDSYDDALQICRERSVHVRY